MDQLLLQRTRYVLRSRIRRVQTCPAALFVPTCQHLLKWIENHPVLSGIVCHLKEVPGEYKEQVTMTLNDAPEKVRSGGGYDPGFYSAESSEEHAAACLAIVSAIAGLDSAKVPPHQKGDMGKQMEKFVVLNFGEYLTGDRHIKYDQALESLRDVAVDGLYEYLDEHIDTRNMLYAVLQKYKQRAEWFRRTRLRQIADNGLEGRTGERALALDLQEYVLDQGVEFVVEPLSASGEADLILRDSEGRYIIIDAKYIPADTTRSKILKKIASGFNQVSRYCDDYNEPAGFLVPFTRTSTKIRLELEESDSFRFLTLGGKTIYYLPVSIADLPSASTEGRAKEVSISTQELVDSITGPD